MMMSNILRKKLVIELRSDLIVGSGEGWGNTVDTDIIYDQYGFPYIPAKRIKGLLKEAALELEEFHILTTGTSENVFGNEENKGHHFVLYNAFLDHIDEMKDEIDHLKKDYQKYVTIPSVLNHYTTVRHQTAIDHHGIALANSLRSSRVILKNQKFYADMECEQQDLELIEKCIKMVHHMGMNRNRGFGEVDLYIEDNADCLKSFQFDMKDDMEYDVQLYLENKTELSMSSFQKEKSLDYISGSSLLGYFANEYLKNHDTDQRFYDLFVLGHVKFSNAYISDKDWNEYFPVRESLYKQKAGNQYFDKTIEDSQDILKKVRHQYVSSHCIKEVEKELYYHHRRPQDKSIGHVVNNERIENGTFYQLEVISAHQRFIAHINGLGKDLKDILSTVSSYIQIGKSKYTQYGNVYVDHILYDEVKTHVIPAGTEVVCTLISPLLQLDHKKESQLDPKVLIDLLHLDNPQCFVGYTNIGGYHAKWKLQKPSYIAFSAGSCIKGILKEDVHEKLFIGNLVQEGLGQILVQNVADVKIDFNNLSRKDSKKDEKTKVPYYTKEIIIDGLKHELRLSAMKEMDTIVLEPLMTKTLIGRLLHMLENSSWDLFMNLTQQIADKDKNKAVAHFIQDVQNKCDQLLNHSLLSQFVNEQDKREFYIQTCKDYLIHEKIERRDVQ